VQLTKQDLTEFIEIFVLETNQHKDAQGGNKLAQINVRITDKIQDAFQVISKMFGSSGDILYQGKPIDNDSSFIDLHIPNSA